jgi:hypothetical protein
MTARERKASGGMSLAAPAPGASHPPLHANGRNGADGAAQRADASRPLRWEDWFQSASSVQRSEMLALAARQGLLYANQLPAPDRGQKNKASVEGQARAQAFSRLLAEQTDDLAPFEVQPVVFLDAALDCAQREAVARALSTPDIFLLQGLPGTGRSRVVAEILNQAAARGERALFLAKRPCSLDVVLSRLTHGQAVFALRFLDEGETAVNLAAEVMPFTLAERQRDFREQASRQAAKARAEAESRVPRYQGQEGCWGLLREIADRRAVVWQRLEECVERSGKVAGDVERDANAGAVHGPLAEVMAELERAHLKSLEALKIQRVEQAQQLAAAAAELAEVNKAIAALVPLAEAKRHGRWWTLAWWRASYRGQVLLDAATLESRRQALESSQQGLAQAHKESQERCQFLQELFQSERTRHIQTEIDRRHREVVELEHACRRELGQLAAEWQKHLDTLEPAHRPAQETRAAVETSAATWEQQRQLDVEAYQFACRWEDYLAKAGDQLVSRIPDWANVLAGTMTALSRDACFANAAAAPLDLLVLEDADQFTDTEVLQAAGRAARWVLVAESQGAGAIPGSMPGRSQLLRPGCFQKLWQGLRCDSPRLHYVWAWEDGRLCCTLRPVSAQDRAYLEVERVADFPEIELRILAVPKAPPLLAQVVFPAAMTVAQAKEFIYRELQEAAVQGLGGGAWVTAEAERFLVHLSPVPLAGAVSLELEKGLRERVVPTTAYTCRLEFDVAAGWTRTQVDQWLGRHLHMRDLGRTMSLQVPYRMAANLARSVSEILFGGTYVVPAGQEEQGGLEFIAVPPLRQGVKALDHRKPFSVRNGLSALPREGAGLALDLAAVRGADRMPADVRADLPRHGFANYLEAQAVLRKLEELLSHGETATESVAVVALYDGQATLLRRLAGRSESLRRRANCFEVGLPGDFRQREWTTVLVSLTRSHGHRAVPFGDQESDLVVALTRARTRLILVGDAGAIVKRSYWHGPLDHLDAAAAAVEAARATALSHWLARSLQNSP